MKSRVAERERAAANKKKFALLLGFAWLVEIRKLWLLGKSHFPVGIRLVVEFEGVISIGEVLFCQLLVFAVGFDPVK